MNNGRLKNKKYIQTMKLNCNGVLLPPLIEIQVKWECAPLTLGKILHTKQFFWLIPVSEWDGIWTDGC